MSTRVDLDVRDSNHSPTFVNERRSFRISASEAPPAILGGDLVVGDFFGRADGVIPGPQGFGVEIPPHSTSPTHFHSVDQFQVFYPAPGAWYRRRELTSVFLHYADAYTTYGPFGTGERPLKVFTCRSSASTVTAYMPRDRKLLPDLPPRRNIHIDLAPWLSRTASPDSATVDSLIEPHADGLAAYLISAGENATVTTPPPERGNGQYFCVLSGVVVHGGAEFTEASLGYCPSGPTALTVTASPEEGFKLLVLQLPSTTAPSNLSEHRRSVS